VRKGSRPRVMAVLRNFVIDVCSFSAKASPAAANRHGHMPPPEVGGTPVNPTRRKKRPRGLRVGSSMQSDTCDGKDEGRDFAPVLGRGAEP
jgi:hypothetical protein